VLTDSSIKTKSIDPFILSLVSNIGAKRSLLDNLESININQEFSNIQSNEKGKEFYIENEFHKAKGFRKLHVEIAEFSNNLKILHCVFFPDPLFNIPIFGLDLVKTKNIVSAAIVDLSPISKSNKDIDSLLNNVKKDGFTMKREIPNWGNIFSENVFFASLMNLEEQNSFYNIVDQYLSILINVSKDLKPDLNTHSIKERTKFQRNYCIQQMKNQKTSIVLLNYFSKNWVDRYIKEILFDF
tara:strand:- start:2358 stop:3080 length:723 start_codon:yes stop_codon:yes gene_type:complete